MKGREVIKIFKPRTLREFVDYMEEMNNQGYDCYFANGIPVIEYFEIVKNGK